MMVVGRASSGDGNVRADDLGQPELLGEARTSCQSLIYIYIYRPAGFPGQGEARMMDLPRFHGCELLIIQGTKAMACGEPPS